MYGHFFEDINYGADGGLYAEMVKNRSFEFPQRLMGWKTFGNVAVEDDGPFDRNPHYVRLTPPDHPHMATGIENEGFFGMGVVQGSEYRFTVWARGKAQSIRVELVDNASMEETQTLAGADLAINSEEWKKYELRLTPARTLDKAHLRIFLTSGGTVDLEHVSLFPVDTWKGRENGLRKDLVQGSGRHAPGRIPLPGRLHRRGHEHRDPIQLEELRRPRREPPPEHQPLAIHLPPPLLPRLLPELRHGIL